jgi:AmpE protein
MTFIVVLISLLIERFFDWSHVRQWRWFTRYQTWVSTRLKSWSAIVALLACVLPLVIVAGLIDSFLSGWFLGLLKLVFSIVILMYCFGPKNIWAEAYASLNLLSGDDPQAIVAHVQAKLGVTLPPDSQQFHRALISLFFTETNRRIFAVMFWFILLGPLGAVLYRTVDLCEKGLTTMRPAMRLQSLLDWLPVRLFAILCALGGHFTEVLPYWKRYALASPRTNDACLTECGIAAVDVLDLQRMPEDGSAEKETLLLLDRVFIIALVILAMAVLIS